MSIRARDTSRGRVYDVRYRGPDGREISRTFLTKRDALEFEAQQRTAKSRGTWIDPRGSKITMRELGAEWLESNPAKRDSTWARDESALRVHVYPDIGDRTIGSLTPVDIRRLVAKWSEDLAARSVRRIYGTLRAALNYAVEVDRLARTPCRGIHLPAAEPVKAIVPDPVQLIELADTIDPDYSAMIWLGAVLGLRWGEVAGLRVGHVDVLRKTVTIAEQVTRGRGGAGDIGPPKSTAARRTISIPSELADELSDHMKALELTGADPEELLFPNDEGRPLDYSNWRRRVWEPATEAAGLDGLNFHDLRRTNATAMVAEGVDVKTAQARLGHSDPRLTLAIYAQATTEGDRSAADKLGARLMLSPESGEASSIHRPWVSETRRLTSSRSGTLKQRVAVRARGIARRRVVKGSPPTGISLAVPRCPARVFGAERNLGVQVVQAASRSGRRVRINGQSGRSSGKMGPMTCKVRLSGAGLHLFDRETGLNILLDEIAVTAEKLSLAPRYLSIALTNACGLRCSYCYAPKFPAALDVDRVVAWAAELDSAGCLGIGFGGGEPTSHPRFVQLCQQLAMETSMAVTFTTHGHRLTTALADALRGSVHFARLSVDGVGATYERLRGRPFAAVRDAATLLRPVAPIGINTVVNADTIGELDDLAEFADEVGASELLLLPEQPTAATPGISSADVELLVQWVHSARPKMRLAISRSGLEDSLPVVEAIPGEPRLDAHMHVDATGVLRPHSFSQMGTPIRASILDAIHTLRRTS